MDIALLSNININSLGRRLQKKRGVFLAQGYNTWTQELLNPDSAFCRAKPENCFVFIDGNQLLGEAGQGEYKNTIDIHAEALTSGIENSPDCHFFVCDMDFCRLEITAQKDVNYLMKTEIEFYWQQRINDLAVRYTNCYVFGFKELVEKFGRDFLYSPKIWYMSGNVFSAKGEALLAEKIERLLSGAAKKCLVLDLDNTLWGGVAAEDGEIELDETGAGARYKDFQRKLLQIKRLGVVLAIASKNNAEDIEPFLLHEHMVLKSEDFVAKKISWQPKPQSVAEIAAELNIGLDSIVFVDDNPVEREQMRQAQTKVAVPEFPTDTADLSGFAQELYEQYFFRLQVSDEDRNKTLMYAENSARESYNKSFRSLDEFLENLAIRVEVSTVAESDVLRVWQLLNKTNQFNLTGKTYSRQEITDMLHNPEYLLLLGAVSDKFGDSGKSVLLIGKYAGDVLTIENFLMSCRIMGRTIEYGFLQAAADIARGSGAKKIIAAYVPTGRNAAIENLLSDMNYEKTGDFYELNLSEQRLGAKSFAQYALPQ